MKSLWIAWIIVFSVALSSSPAVAGPYEVGNSFVGFSAPDQHGKEVPFRAGAARYILFDTPGESGKSQHPQDPNWFVKHRALLIMNISDMSAMKRSIARSRMKKRTFQMLVVDDESVAAKFPRQKGRFTVFELDDKGAITRIKFAAPGEGLPALMAVGNL